MFHGQVNVGEESLEKFTKVEEPDEGTLGRCRRKRTDMGRDGASADIDHR
jgi:hypothetical protein